MVAPSEGAPDDSRAEDPFEEFVLSVDDAIEAFWGHVFTGMLVENLAEPTLNDDRRKGLCASLLQEPAVELCRFSSWGAVGRPRTTFPIGRNGTADSAVAYMELSKKIAKCLENETSAVSKSPKSRQVRNSVSQSLLAPALVPLQPPAGPAPAHEARVFLRERLSGRYLTVCGSSSEGERCVTTRVAASLFVAEHSACSDRRKHQDAFGVGDAGEYSMESETERLQRKASLEDSGVRLGFCHEGLPSADHFLGCEQSFWGWVSFGCQRKALGSKEEFLWMEDGAVLHVLSGLWLDVDPEYPEEPTLHSEKRSFWEALPAL
jgi:hypothetical protein